MIEALSILGLLFSIGIAETVISILASNYSSDETDAISIVAAINSIVIMMLIMKYGLFV